MDFEKEYKDMVQRARELHESGNALTKQQMEIVCPQLADSEDERIRKAIISALNGSGQATAILKNKGIYWGEAIAYLEKQKEPFIIHDTGCSKMGTKMPEYCLDVKPAEWSEEDEKMIERLIRHTQKEFDELCNDRYGHQEIISDLKESCRERMRWLKKLKSLRPQPHWKPSEEQMTVLSDILEESKGPRKEALEGLYKNLKQL